MIDLLRAASFLARVMGAPDGRPGRVWPLALATGPVEALVYEPSGPAWATVVAVHGMTLRAHLDPRMIATCRALAATGVRAISPRVLALDRLSVDPAAVEHIGRVVAAVASDERLGSPGRVGLFSASFAAGLCLVAAARPEVADHVSASLLIGTYIDVRALIRHSLAAPTGDVYGRQILVRALLGDSGDLSPGVRQALDVALADTSLRRAPELPALLAMLSEADRSAFHRFAHDPSVADALAERIFAVRAAWCDQMDAQSAVGRLSGTLTLIHGREDPVIPVSESQQAYRLARAAGVGVRLHVTDLLGHGDLALGPRQLAEGPAIVTAAAHWFASLRYRDPRRA